MASKSVFASDLKGKVALVTGASRGIGRAIAINLASRGCSILGTCLTPENVEKIESIRNAEKVQESLKVIGISASIYDASCANVIAGVLEEKLDSRVDIFVNNAADPFPGAIGNLTVHGIQQSLLGNIQTPVLIVEELVKRQMFQPESRIIYISSIRSRQPWADQLMYAAGKSAGESLCRTWAEAFGGKDERYAFMAGTTANSVTVGLTQTDSVMRCPPEALEGFRREFLPLQSIPRFGQPEDVADVVGLLCSHHARWITGCVISASGGGIRIG